MKFIHPADWHSVKRLHDFSLREEQEEALQRIDNHVPQIAAMGLFGRRRWSGSWESWACRW